MYKATSVSNLSMFGMKGVIKEGTNISELCQQMSQFVNLYRQDYGYCTKSCFDLEKMSILLQFSAYENLNQPRKNGKREEVLQKLLVDNDINAEDLMSWLNVMADEFNQANRPAYIIRKTNEMTDRRLSLEDCCYRKYITPHPVLCIIMAEVVKNYNGNDDNLMNLFNQIDRFLSALNKTNDKKETGNKYYQFNEKSNENFNFLEFSKFYSWPVTMYEKISKVKKEAATVRHQLQARTLSKEKLQIANQSVTNELHALKIAMDSLKQEYMSKGEEIAVLSEQIRSRSQEKKILRANGDNLSLRVEKLTVEKRTLGQELETKEREYKELIQKYNQSEQSGTELKSQIQSMENKLSLLTKEKNSIVSEYEKKNKELVDAKKQLDEITQANSIANKRNTEMHALIKQSSLEQEKLLAEYNTKTLELQKALESASENAKTSRLMKEQIDQIQLKLAEYDATLTVHKELLIKSHKLEAQLKEQTASILKLTQEKDSSTSMLTSLKSEHSKLLLEYEKMTGQVSTLTMQLKDRAAEYNKIMIENKSISESLEPRIQKLIAENALLLAENSKVSTNYSQQCQELVLAKKVLEMSDEKWNQQSQKLNILIKNLNDEKAELRSNYDESKILIAKLTKELETANQSYSIISGDYKLLEKEKHKLVQEQTISVRNGIEMQNKILDLNRQNEGQIQISEKQSAEIKTYSLKFESLESEIKNYQIRYKQLEEGMAVLQASNLEATVSYKTLQVEFETAKSKVEELEHQLKLENDKYVLAYNQNKSLSEGLSFTNQALKDQLLEVQHKYDEQILENHSMKLILNSKEQEYAIIKQLLEDRDRQIIAHLEEISLLKTSNLELEKQLNPSLTELESDNSGWGSLLSPEDVETAKVNSEGSGDFEDISILDSAEKD